MIIALIPFVCWMIIGLFLVKKGLCWRSAFLSSSVVCGIVLTAITEILSYFQAVAFSFVLMSWGGATIIAILLYYKTDDNSIAYDLSLTRFLRTLLGGIIIIVVITGFIALVAPPNNWDSMTYHMSRVAHWMQNKSVVHYPTNIIRQLELSPWAEFAIMHLNILSRQDRLSNLVQWFSMVGSIIGVTLIAKQFGASMRGQIFSAAIAVSIPMGILQASSTQNDYVVSFWIVCFVYFSLRYRNNLSGASLVASGASLGLAILTKGTTYIYATPFLVWFCWEAVKSKKWKIMPHMILFTFVILSLNAGYFGRNYMLFGNPLSSDNAIYKNGSFTVPVFVSNAVRNLTLHLSTRSDRINLGIEKAVVALHNKIGADVNDQQTSLGGTQFTIAKMRFHEDSAGNPLHLAVIAFTAGLALTRKTTRQHPDMGPYMGAAIAAALFFVLILKWQPWASRLHLPLFVLWAPIAGTMLGCADRIRAVDAVIAVLLLAALPYLIVNESRPLINHGQHPSILSTSRIGQYFNNRPQLEQSYAASAATIQKKNCANIGIMTGADDWEYPLWVLAKQMNNTMPRIEHINVMNKSADLMLKNFEPCLVFKSDGDGNLREINASGSLQAIL